MKKIFRSPMVVVIYLGLILSCTTSRDGERNKREDKEITNRSLLGLGFGIANATLIVKDLDLARNYYANVLGFNMPSSEKYENGLLDETVSASAYFPDMSSIQLLAVKDSTVTSADHQFINSFLKQDEGVGLYSLSTSSADATLQWLTSQKFTIDSIRSGRATAKQPLRWDGDNGGPDWRCVTIDSKNRAAYLPNYIEHIDFPYQEFHDKWKSVNALRKYDNYNHPNGVVGIAALRIAATDLRAVGEEFKKMGLVELGTDDSLMLRRFKTAQDQELQLIAPQSVDDELTNFLQARGSGVFAILFEVEKIEETYEFFKRRLPGKALRFESLPKRLVISKEHANGLQLEFMEESKEQRSLARIFGFKNGSKLDTASLRYATGIFTKHCSTCHGGNRSGNAHGNLAPSLRSHSLMGSTLSSNYLKHTISYGRQGTSMGAYAKTQGGPLSELEIDLLVHWLYELSGVDKPINLPSGSVTGNVALGKTLYAKKCASCHGTNGEGGRGPALGNRMLLATASDGFIRYAISEGRENTMMPSFKDSLSNSEIDAVTAYLRRRISGWNTPDAPAEALPNNYVLSPENKTPTFFTLREGLFLPPRQLVNALKDSSRIVILDARSKAAWHQAHIPGAISIRYEEEPDTFLKNIPNDNTWIVVYCDCNHGASKQVLNTLKRFGYKNTAVLDEGIFGWIKHGHPVVYGLGDETNNVRHLFHLKEKLPGLPYATLCAE